MTYLLLILGLSISSVFAQERHCAENLTLKPEVTTIVVGILFNGAGEVLLGERQPPQDHVGLWEFPGGKVETSDASPEAALIREWQEEVGIEVAIDGMLWKQPLLFDKKPLMIHFYRVRQVSPHEAPMALAHSRLAWVGAWNLSQYPFIVSNHPIWSQIWPGEHGF